MKNLKMISITLGLTLASTGCSQYGALESLVKCEDRFCTMSSKITIDQTDVTQSMAYQGDGVHAMGLLEDLVSLTPVLTQVASLAPPSVNGAPVQASDITVSGNKVYVAYNTAGNTQAGGIDVIDIANPNAIALASEALYSSMDIHKVYVNGTKLYAAGADYNGSALRRIDLDANGKLTATTNTVSLRSASSASTPAYAAVSVVANANGIYALSGNNGGLEILNNDMTSRSFTAIEDARDIKLNAAGNGLFVVTGKMTADAAIKGYTTAAGAAQGTNVTLPNATIDQGKSTLLSGNVVHIATAGSGGARLICISNGTTLGLAANPAISGIPAAKQVANAATFGAGYMFVANGEAGVSIYSVNTPLIPSGCNLVTITYLGRFSVGANVSVNNVSYSNGYLIVATGIEGFKMIKVTTSVLSGLLQAL